MHPTETRLSVADAPEHTHLGLTRTLIGIFASSLVVVLSEAFAGFFAVLDSNCLGASATAIGLVPLFASAAAIALSCCGQLSFEGPLWPSSTTGALLATLFTLWWLAGTTLLTFWGPFLITNNPYFGCWAALITSCRMLIATSGRAQDAFRRSRELKVVRPFAGLLLSSAVLFGACLRHVFESGEAIYILAVTVTTAVFVVLLLLQRARLAQSCRTIILIVILLLWVSVVWMATFVGPFALTGNGFFSAWLGLPCALLALHRSAKPDADALPGTHALDGPQHGALRHGAASAASVVTTYASSESLGSSTHGSSHHPKSRTRSVRTLVGLIGFFSCVVLIMSANGRIGLGLYAFVVGGVSLALVLVVFIHHSIQPREAAELAHHSACKSCDIVFSVNALLAIFLTLWWAAGATVMTFFGPFTATSNPYISCWAALICCIFMLIDTINPHLTDDAEEATGIASGRGSKRAYAGLFFASLVMIGSSAALQARNWELVLSIACCGVTLLIVFLLILDGAQLNEPLFSYRLRALLVLVLMLLWILVVWFATFSGPFNVTGETT